jgi:hypothetical protein
MVRRLNRIIKIHTMVIMVLAGILLVKYRPLARRSHPQSQAGNHLPFIFPDGHRTRKVTTSQNQKIR